MEKDITETSSPATKYETMLAELGGLGTGPTEDKILLVFQVLDQIIPHLGVFVSVMKMCRDEIFDAVFSEQYTGSGTRNSAQYIQKLPYFAIIQREKEKKDDNNHELAEQLDVVKKRLFDKQQQYEEARDTIDELREEIRSLKQTIDNLQSDISDRHEDIQRLELMMEEMRESFEATEYQLNSDISELQSDLHDAKAEGNYLRKYKLGYDDLQAAFTDRAVFEPFTPKKKKRSSVANKRSHFISGIENASKLEEQILGVQNATLEEYDRFLEDHKNILLGNIEVDDDEELEGPQILKEEDIEQADEELLIMQERFQKNIHDIITELELLKQHKMMLQEQLQLIEENKPSVKRKNKSRRGSRPQTQESGLSGGLEDEEEEENAFAFNVQERVFSKYACMIYTSDNNGKTFHEFKNSKYCPSCCEKTVLCPHKILGQEHVFTLPPSVTHIKISRPKVRINMEAMDNMFREATETDILAGLSSAGAVKRMQSCVSMSANMSPCVNSKSPGESIPSTDISALPGANSDNTHFRHHIHRLWEDFKSRTKIDRHISRPIPLSRAMSLIEQFASFIINADDVSTENDEVYHILDHLYVFLFERYMNEDIAYLAAHDFLAALAENHMNSKIIWLFIQCLIGNLDGSVFRYILLIGDFIEKVSWKAVEDFRSFAAVVYPFLNEDDLETLHMGYTSFSENKISKSLVVEYIIHSIMKYREPRFLEMENKLLMTPGKELNCMTEAEFVESSDTVLGVVNDKLRKRLFSEANAYVQLKDGMTNGVPILRLAQITSYLGLLHIAPVIFEDIAERVAANRETESSIGRGVVLRPTHCELQPTHPLLTLQGAKGLALNITRRNRCRKMRERGGLDD